MYEHFHRVISDPCEGYETRFDRIDDPIRIISLVLVRRPPECINDFSTSIEPCHLSLHREQRPLGPQLSWEKPDGQRRLFAPLGKFRRRAHGCTHNAIA
jgi:hypothetical protein